MSTDPNDRPAEVEPKPDSIIVRDPPDPAAASGIEGDTPVISPVMSNEGRMGDDTPEGDGSQLPGNATGPASGESLASAIDGASRPDRVAIGLMVGVVVLLLICAAFGFAAR